MIPETPLRISPKAKIEMVNTDIKGNKTRGALRIKQSDEIHMRNY